jgi:hypothetical protein
LWNNWLCWGWRGKINGRELYEEEQLRASKFTQAQMVAATSPQQEVQYIYP